MEDDCMAHLGLETNKNEWCDYNNDIESEILSYFGSVKC